VVIDSGPAPAPLAPPTITPSPGGNEINDVSVSIEEPSASAATICYTLDGSVPTCTNGVCAGAMGPSPGPITFTLGGCAVPGTIVRAIACEPGATRSAVSSEVYTFNTASPVAVPSPGVVAAGANPTFTTATNADPPPSFLIIRATLVPDAPPTCTTGASSGTEQPTFSELFGGPILETTTVQVIACKSCYLPSAVTNFTFTVAPPDAGSD
jgi:hypothetical protein